MPARTASRPAARRPSRSRKPARPAPGARRRSFLWRFRRLFFLLGLLVVAGLAGVAYILANVPLPAAAPPVETTFIFDANGNKLAELSTGENRVVKELDEMSPHLIDAVLAAEDRDFFTHPGIDASAILRATWADIRGRPLQGGSTITQQYVKQVYTDKQRTLVRKLKEATLAVKLERKLDKREILERYLNLVYFGRGAHGVQAAARSYFNKDVGELGVAEAAYLAGLIRAPEVADANKGDAAATGEADRRRDNVLRAMQEEGYITAGERQAISAVPVISYVRPREEVVQDRIRGKQWGTEHFVEYVRRQLADRYGDARLNGGGLQIHTTLDLGLQQRAYEAVYNDTLNREGDPAGALVALDLDGRVKAMVGGRSFDDSRVNLAVGREGGGGGRQPGSSFKPFVLAEALEQGYSAESAVPAPGRIEFPGLGDNGEPYRVRNYEQAEQGTLNLIDAMRVSSNTVYAQVGLEVGTDEVADMAGRLGVRSELHPVPSISLGSQNVSVLDMADAYLTFATRGVHVEPSVVTRVTTAEGGLIDEFPARKARAVEPNVADTVTYALRRVVEQGTGTRANIGEPVAGKTGTTQNYGDAWFIGYTPGLSTAVWMGYPEGQDREMTNVHGQRITGGSLPADIFRRFMVEATAGDRYGGDFVEPDGFPGRPLTGRGRITEVIGEESGDDEPEETTTTEVPDDGTATTEAPADGSTTTEPPETTTTEPPETTTTTAPSTTTTTESEGAPLPGRETGGPDP